MDDWLAIGVTTCEIQKSRLQPAPKMTRTEVRRETRNETVMMVKWFKIDHGRKSITLSLWMFRRRITTTTTKSGKA
jgi:hypothetical protein